MTPDHRPSPQLAADPDAVEVRPAATVMLVRGAEGDVEGGGVEVFMLRRVGASAFAPGMYVFPGGRVDDVDHTDELEPYCTDLDDAAASARLGIDHGGLAYWVAAVRECFEESGLLLATPRDGGVPAVDAADRRAVHRGELTMAELCERRGVVLELGRIRYVAHWVTPRGERRRFDTRFFLAPAPEGQDGVHDDAETDDSRWVPPTEALAMVKARELRMLPPTIANLRFLAGCESVAALLEAADALDPPPRIEPRLRLDERGRFLGLAMPDDADYASLA